MKRPKGIASYESGRYLEPRVSKIRHCQMPVINSNKGLAEKATLLILLSFLVGVNS